MELLSQGNMIKCNLLTILTILNELFLEYIQSNLFIVGNAFYPETFAGTLYFQV